MDDVGGLWLAFVTGRSVEVRNRLIEHYWPLKAVVVSHARRTLQKRTDWDMVEDAAEDAMIEAVGRYDPGRNGGFPSYYRLVFASRLTDAMRRVRNAQNRMAVEPLSDDATVFVGVGGNDNAELAADAYERLEPREKRLVRLCLERRMTVRKLAKVFGVTTVTLCKERVAVMKKLKCMIEACVF